MTIKDKEDFLPELNLFLTYAAWLRNPPNPVTLLAVFTHCRNHSEHAAKADCGRFFPHQTIKPLHLSVQKC